MKKVEITVRELNALVWWATSGVTMSRGGSYERMIIPLLKKLKQKYCIREPRFRDIKWKGAK